MIKLVAVSSSPVYHMRMNARMAAFTDRMRVFIFGNISGRKIKDKIGISASVAWKIHGGFEKRSVLACSTMKPG